jgi:two-component system sensor histidine kinase HydH
MINLVNNAREAIFPAPGKVEIRTRAVVRERRPLALIEITDTGPGVPPAVLSRIFDSFFTTKEKGTGLGLAVSKRIVEEHGGTITVSNRPEGGATFMLTLPRP